MAVGYTDVDLMILKRWEEVSALREAFDDLLGRMKSTVEVALQRAVTKLKELGFDAEYDPKAPSLSFWKPEWVNRKGEGVYGKIVGFAPEDYGRDSYSHPAIYLVSEDFGALRMVESVQQFGKTLRAALTDEQRLIWSHNVELDVNPIAREYGDIAVLDRVQLVMGQEPLTAFLTARVDEFMDLVPVIDATLRRMTRR